MSEQAVAELGELGEAPLAVTVLDHDQQPVAVALVRVGDDVFAIQDECSHAMVRLSEGDVDVAHCHIECYLHGSVFDLRTGRPLNLPATEPVPVYPCRVQNGQVLVDVTQPLSSPMDNQDPKAN